MVGTRLLLLASVAAAAPATAQQVASIQLSHQSLTLTPGGRQTVFATAYSSAGSPLSTTFRWISSNPSVVIVEVTESESDFADIVGVAQGSAHVQVQAGGHSQTLSVTVVHGGEGSGPAAVLNVDPPTIQLLRGETRELTPLFLRADGERAAPMPVTWTSLNPSVASVDASSGLVVGIATGQGAIQVSAGGLSKVATVEVADVPFGFTVPVLGLSPNTERTIGVVVPSQRNRPLGKGGLTWESSDRQVVQVTPLGVATGIGPGRATIHVEGYGQVRELPVTVHRPVAEAVVVPPTDRGAIQVPLDGARPFKLTSLASDGTEIPEAPVTWSVGDTTVAAFDTASGALTGRRMGTTTLRAQAAAPGLDFEWHIEVIAGGVLVAPARFGMNVGDSLAVAASFTTEEGTPLGPASGVRWATADANVAAVDRDGHVRGTGDGYARVIASTPWGSADTADVFVSGPLLFASTRTGSSDLFTLDPAAPGRAAHQVTTAPSNEVMGAWSPDGARIAFVSDRDGNLELYVADAAGGSPMRLTTTPAVSELSPEWTHDGRRIVYTAQPANGRAQVWLVNVDGTGAKALTTDAQGANLDPAVSPDGRLIAFTSTRDGNYETYVMDIDGTNQRAALVSPFKETKPAWFPNGDLAFVQDRTEGARIVSVVVRIAGTAGGTPATISPPDLPVTDFAVTGSGDGLVLEVTEPESGGHFDHRLALLTLGGAAVDLPRDGEEQMTGPAIRPPRPRPQ